ncbi:MAG TPA: styrene monooxygenase/indole monooxygenase family protein [Aromatoleum sp.]|uniref:styrene monooxygenase/indole monooxygenase family protein n=1 Tax=Aromatoleum sp. TaxID=2307007 RepID=UPI002B47EAD7|nr:styrene monooxygenase/indole monooxygenase family protein [Aromatoleum sp.]HJV27909.1 styrene monooxygenase/indole monooxygenase family protein [Aromatoleum sp.]
MTNNNGGRSIAIVGAGQAGLLLGTALLDQGYEVTLVTNRTAQEVWSGKVLSSQFMFDPALQIERGWKMAQWEAACPKVTGVNLSIPGPAGRPAVDWNASLYACGQSIDQRVKMPGWMKEFERRGGELRIENVDIPELEALAARHELVLLAGGKGEIVNLFGRNDARSPVRQPMRQLALTYVTGMKRHDRQESINFNLIPGVGEYFVFPALTTQGSSDTQACDIMVFEGVPGGPMDCWGDVKTPEQHLEKSLEILRTFVPWEYERSRDCQLTDANGLIAGRITPTVRNAVLTLPSGRKVMGLGDAILVNDPITGQGSNNATKSAKHYFDAILARGRGGFDEAWMNRTFDTLYDGYAEKVVRWTNSLLFPPPAYIVKLLAAAQQSPSLAYRIANGFNDPRDFAEYWFDEARAEELIAAELSVAA